MRTPALSLRRLATAASCAIALAACARSDVLTAPPSDCPAAVLSRASHSLAPGGSSLATNGCAHRAPVEIPLAQVIDLNDNGQVLGVRITGGSSELVIWSRSGIVPLLTPPGASGVTGVDVNNNGEAVGCGMFPPPPDPGPGTGPVPTSRHPTFATNAAPVCHVIRWNAQGVPTDLGLIDPTAHEAIALAINDAGVIVGTVITSTGQRAFVRSADGTVTFIPTPGTRSAAVALNEQGEVAGWYTNGSAQHGPWHAFTWTAAGGRVDVPALPSGFADAEASLMPVAINESGEVLGTLYAYHPATPTVLDRRSTFLYSRTAGIRGIGASSGFTNVVALNDQGEILGWSTLDGLLQPVSWATTRPSQLAVRFDWHAGEGAGTSYQINNWNEVLDSYVQGGVLHNVVWTWNPERYR